MKNADYWQGRAEENALKVFRYSQRQAQLVTRWFGRAERDMSKKIVEFYKQYAVKNSISLPAAKAAMTDRRALNITLEECRALAQKSPLDTELAKLLDKAYLGRAISREEFLKMQLELLASEIYNRYAETTKTSLTNVFEESYYKSIFDYQQFTGFGSGFNRISTHQIEAAVTTAWQGKNYSERIWGGHRKSLARYLNRIITNGFIQGVSGERMTAELHKAMDVSAYKARRLIRTECAQVASRASLFAYRENGTPEFEFLAVLDYKTSELCRSMDGKHFALSEGRIGVNMPPLHPFCRSTTVPYIPDAELDTDDTRVARGGDGETYKVPASMNYRGWHKQHVENNPAELLAERKYKGGAADAAQYDKYIKLLGRDAPKTFDDFQNIKYTGGDSWNDLKNFATYKRKYQGSNRAYYEINKDVQVLREQGLVDKRIGIAVTPVAIRLESYGSHALKRMLERNFGTEDAQSYITDAIVEFRQFKNTRSAFYSQDGVTAALRSTKAMVTGWEKSDFDEQTDRIMEVLKKHYAINK